MRIQNNITAMNTHRQYTINNDNVAKAAEKLSSGYRINRAGDDAAGLAISEKMRSQIRGLNMATKNSQDAISLVQTAEGALQETQNMLQRMNELAVQAATGTNETLDRNALAKEFEQLKREINDIAEQTTFNNMKILDGSLSYSGYVRSAQTAGVNSTIEDITGASAKNPISSAAVVNGTDVTPISDAVAGKVGFASGSFALLKNTADTAASDPIGVASNATQVPKGVTYEVELSYQKEDGTTATLTATVDNTDIGTGNLGTAVAAKLQSALTASTDEAFADLKGDYQVSFDGSTVNVEEQSSKEGTNSVDLSKLSLSVKQTYANGTPQTKAMTAQAAGSGNQVYTLDVNTTGFDALRTATAAGQPTKQITVEFTGTETTTGAADGGYAKIVIDVPAGKEGADVLADAFKEGGQGWDTLTATSGGTATDLFVAHKGGDDNITLSTAGNGTFFNGAVTMKVTVGYADVEESISKTEMTPGAAAVTQATDATPKSQTHTINIGEEREITDSMTAAERSAAEEYNKGLLQEGATLTIDGTTYTYTKSGTGANDFSSVSDLATKVGQNSSKLDASASGNSITLSAKVDGEAVDAADVTADNYTQYVNVTDDDLKIDWAGPKGSDKKTTVEFDFAKLQVGDEISIKIAGYDAVKVEKTANDTRASFMDKIKDKINTINQGGKDDRLTVNGNALIASGVNIEKIELTKDGLEGKETNAIRIQVGALENEQLSVSIDSMNTKGLGLDDAFLMSQDNPKNAATLDQDAAGDAITKVRAAINKVSDQRATLGAMQNRLDHKIANLKVASENLSASESRIRDVDMAQEMTNFTKNNILSQASTAMLAQANALPQNVLSLLG